MTPDRAFLLEEILQNIEDLPIESLLSLYHLIASPQSPLRCPDDQTYLEEIEDLLRDNGIPRGTLVRGSQQDQ